MPKIKGGFYLKAKCIQSSYIAHTPPCVREIWDWMLMKALYKDGKELKRGQLLCTYKDIQEGLHWNIGFRKITYSKWDCERAMKALMKSTMITTTKTTWGLVISIVNYDKYQDSKNYEDHNESHNDATNHRNHHIERIVKERKEEEETPSVNNMGKKKKPFIEGDPAWQDPADPSHWRVLTHTGEWKDYAGDVKKKLTYR